MDIEHRIRDAANLTPTEQQLACTVLALGGRLHDLSLKELARTANVSIPSVHRFCKKLGLEGFKELKVEFARGEHQAAAADVDINFPFDAGDTASSVLPHIASVYETTLADTQALLEPAELDRAAALIDNARRIDVYTQSHNTFPAQMFCNRLLSIGRTITCYTMQEQLVRTALSSTPSDVAIAISYSGMGPNLATILPILRARNVPVIFISTPTGCDVNPGLEVYLPVSDRESLQTRITQFASHIAVQYVLNALFCCVFARSYDASREFLESSLPYTRIPALHKAGRA